MQVVFLLYFIFQEHCTSGFSYLPPTGGKWFNITSVNLTSTTPSCGPHEVVINEKCVNV